MIQRPYSKKYAPVSSFFLALLAALTVNGADPPVVREATPEAIRTFFKAKKMRVLTFAGYSGAGYENNAVMLRQATQVLSRFDPKKTIVNIGATPDGIGAVYELAKQKSFLTTGIVSTQAKENKVPLSPFADVVFYVKDASWGGFLPGTKQLSPTSLAMIENSDVIVAIGGGEVAKDELSAAKRTRKRVEFYPADFNHRVASEKAQKKGQPVPTNFRGAASTLF